MRVSLIIYYYHCNRRIHCETYCQIRFACSLLWSLFRCCVLTFHEHLSNWNILWQRSSENNPICTAVFYRAMLRIARYCYGKLSVRLSVRLSVTFRYRDHIGFTSKIISRLVSLALCRPQHHGSTPMGTPWNFGRNAGGVSKVAFGVHKL